MTGLNEEPSQAEPVAGAQTTPQPFSTRIKRALQAVATHRLVHFAILGSVTWWFAPKQTNPRIVELDEAQIKGIWAAEARKHAAQSLTEQEKQDALVQYVEDEVLFREGLRVGLDKEDGIVRNRVVQKMMFYAEDLAGASSPTTDENLRAYFEKTRDRWARDPEVKFQQIFISASAHPKDGAAIALGMQSKLAADAALDPSTLGAGLWRGRARAGEWARLDDVRNDLGEAVEKEIAGLPLNTWSAPVVSAFGWHLVRVTERRSSQVVFEDVKPQVLLDYQLDRKHHAISELSKRLTKEYSIKLHLPPGEKFAYPETGSGRVAVRGGE